MDKPLSYKTIAITRDARQTRFLQKELQALGAEVIVFPTIKISAVENPVECAEAIRSLQKYDWIVFSSVNGVRYFQRQLQHLQAKPFTGRVAVVGGKTQQALQAFGRQADLIPDEFTARGLLASFDKLEITGRHFLLPGSDIARDELSDGLEQRGAHVKKIAVYRTVCRQAKNRGEMAAAIDQKQIDALLFYSPSAFGCFLNIMGEDLVEKISKHNILLAAIGPTTARAIAGHGLRVDIVPASSTDESMIEALKIYFTQ